MGGDGVIEDAGLLVLVRGHEVVLVQLQAHPVRKSKTSQLLQRFIHCIGTKYTENKWEGGEEIKERNPLFSPRLQK